MKWSEIKRKIEEDLGVTDDIDINWIEIMDLDSARLIKVCDAPGCCGGEAKDYYISEW